MAMSENPKPQTATLVFPRQKRKRTGKPKSRTGCITCKTRRVKCDEQKPDCQRCIECGRDCEGYKEPVLIVEHRPKSDFITRRMAARERLLIPAIQQPFSGRFRNEDEYRYFQLYRTKTAYYLGGHFESDLWTKIILQASESEEYVRDAVIALGALSMTNSMLQEPRYHGAPGTNPAVMPREKKIETSKEHYLFALRHYSQAIEKMKEAVVLTNAGLRAALIASLLIICFETYHGNFQSADRQVKVIAGLLKEYCSNTKNQKIPARPITEIIEQDLIEAVIRLGNQWMIQNAFVTMEDNRALSMPHRSLPRMPPRFTSIREARSHFCAVCCKWYNFTCSLKRTGKTLLSTALEPSTTGNKDAVKSDHALNEHKTHIQELNKWRETFEPLYQKVWRSGNVRDRKASIILELQYLTMCLDTTHIFAAIAGEEVAYDKSHATFTEILRLVENLLDKSEITYTYDIESICFLGYVASKCRDPLTRREAIRLLSCKPRREGTWDSLVAAKFCTWIVDVEEEGMVDGFIPEYARARDIVVKLDPQGGRAEVCCKLLVKDVPGVMRARATVITW